MFFTHHSLGLALLAFLISPACAAPALERRETGTTYTVRALRVNGDPIPMPPQALKNIKASVSAMFPWKKGKKYLPSFLDSSDRIKYEGPMDTTKFDAAKMFYYELEGGVLGAPPHTKCYRYVITPEEEKTVIGSIVSVTTDHISTDFHQPTIAKSLTLLFFVFDELCASNEVAANEELSANRANGDADGERTAKGS
ncbi:hypothetical protein BDP27DRAFT_1418221 [Rhodocollybia butyracea]|uniref:Uncharacterized protein n=1 Tax=Rhodocollybia butyracea TaxID=206335 RepID=A0A9P5U9T4_9AGAR|nr:hypothetical protein BDP27DRAFT_1418221 [Rhodocollybia butyracea]